MAVRARAEWERLEDELGVRLLGREGVLICGSNVPDRAAAFEAAGVPARLVDRDGQAEALPVIAPPGDEALLDELGGSIDVRAAVNGLAGALGERVVFAQVFEVVEQAGRRSRPHLRRSLVGRPRDRLCWRGGACVERAARPRHPAADRAPRARVIPCARAGRVCLPASRTGRARTARSSTRHQCRTAASSRSGSARSTSPRSTRRSRGSARMSSAACRGSIRSRSASGSARRASCPGAPTRSRSGAPAPWTSSPAPTSSSSPRSSASCSADGLGRALARASARAGPRPASRSRPLTERERSEREVRRRRRAPRRSPRATRTSSAT